MKYTSINLGKKSKLAPYGVKYTIKSIKYDTVTLYLSDFEEQKLLWVS